MLEVWGVILSLFNAVTTTVGTVLIFESFFHRRCRGKQFWGVLLLWCLCGIFLQFGPGPARSPWLWRQAAVC